MIRLHKVKVICDTNIWYGLASGQINSSLTNDLDLMSIYYNFDELNSTYHAKNDISKVIKAAKAIVQYSSQQILEQPILYLTRLINRFYADEDYHYNDAMRAWREIRLLARLPEHYQPDMNVEQMYEHNIKQREAEGMDSAAIENQFSKTARSESRMQYKANKTKYFDNAMERIIALLDHYVQVLSKEKVSIPNGFDFRQIELFLEVYAVYLKNLEVGTMKAKPHDTYDLFSMIYVRPGMRYFTLEKRWINMIKEAEMANHYLQLPSNLPLTELQ